MFIVGYVWANQCFKCLMCIISFIFYNNPMKLAMIIVPILH